MDFKVMRYITAAIVCLLAPWLCAQEQTAAVQLQQLLQPIGSLQADFSQSQYGQDGELLDGFTQQGQMQVTKSGQMRWVVAGEYGQQLITNGQTLWFYDPDFESVTIQPFAATGNDFPALLLMGDFERLSSSYQIEQGTVSDSYVLEPLQSSSDYQNITITFEDQLPKSIVVLDALGESTKIEFQQVALNPQLQDSLFEFEPPADADIIYNR